MRNPAFYPLSLILIVLAAALAPFPSWLRALGGGLLFSLWLFGLWRGKGRAAGYLPGHALLFLGLGLVGARAAAYAWLLVPPLTVGLELAGGRRYLTVALYVILWLDLFACLHQLVAAGKGLSGTALWAWSAGVAAIALAFVAVGVLRRAGGGGPGRAAG